MRKWIFRALAVSILPLAFLAFRLWSDVATHENGPQPAPATPSDASPQVARQAQAAKEAQARRAAARKKVQETRRRLAALGYVDWIQDAQPELSPHGVTHYDKALAAPGIQLYLPLHVHWAMVMDLEGEMLLRIKDRRLQKSPWSLVVPYLDEGFLVLGRDDALFKIDFDSNVVWEKKLPVHHEIEVAPDGTIFTLTNQEIIFPAISAEKQMLDNELVVLSPKGEVQQRISFAKMFAKDPELLARARQVDKRKTTYAPGYKTWDVFHTNSIEYVQHDVRTPDGKLVYAAGNVLFCLRHLDMIGAIDLKEERIVWHWGEGILDHPHDPRQLPNGNLQIFDNGVRRLKSRLVEMNPVTGEVEGEVDALPDHGFYTRVCGSSQRLPNGNNLIVQSGRGHVFELTPDGRLAWEFHSLELASDPGKRHYVYRMRRLTDMEDRPNLRAAIEKAKSKAK